MGELSRRLLKNKEKGSSKSIAQSTTHQVVGTGYIVLPTDIERSAYIRSVYEDARLMIATKDNQVIDNVKVPNHILNDLSFPKKSVDLGQEVIWMSVPKSNQYFILAIVRKPGEFNLNNKEYLNVDTKRNNGITIQTITDLINGARYEKIVRSDTEDNGKIAFKIYGQGTLDESRLNLSIDGKSTLHGSREVDIRSVQSLKLQVTDKQDKLTSISIDNEKIVIIDNNNNHIIVNKDGIEIEGEKLIKLKKDADQWSVRGDHLQQQLDKNKARLDQVINALSAAQPAAGSGDGGSALKASIALGLQGINANVENYSQILSEFVKIK